MPDEKDELREAGKIIYPVLRKFVNVEAVYHRGQDLIFKAAPLAAGQEYERELSRQAFEAGFHLNYYRESETLLIVARDIRPRVRRIPWLNLLLFVLTLLSMVIAYSGIKYESRIFRDFSLMWEGVQFALALMPILLFHEFGHYLAARKNRADVSLPYFIPAPTLIGTLGAVIKSRTPFRTRRELFDVGAAGPLAGIVPAVIILAIGFAHSEMIPLVEPPAGSGQLFIGQSLLYQLLRWIFAAPVPPGYVMLISPLIFAGWVGLFVTMINLMPVGQLDGGHIIYALFGPRAQFYLAMLVMLGLLILGFFWPGWFLWAFLALVIIKIKHPPTINDQVGIGQTRTLLGLLSILLFIITFMPIPVRFEIF